MNAGHLAQLFNGSLEPSCLYFPDVDRQEEQATNPNQAHLAELFEGGLQQFEFHSDHERNDHGPHILSQSLSLTVGMKRGRPVERHEPNYQRRRELHGEKQLRKMTFMALDQDQLSKLLHSRTVQREGGPAAIVIRNATKSSMIVQNAERLIAEVKPKHRKFLKERLFGAFDPKSEVPVMPVVLNMIVSFLALDRRLTPKITILSLGNSPKRSGVRSPTGNCVISLHTGETTAIWSKHQVGIALFIVNVSYTFRYK